MQDLRGRHLEDRHRWRDQLPRSGGFGAATITKSIQILCSTGTAGVLVSGTNAIVVNAPANSEVLLQGLDIDGLGTGVQVISFAKVTIQNCSIRNFSQNGVNIAGPGGARVLIANSIILSNNNGVAIAGIGGGANVGILLRTIIDNHAGASVTVATGSTLFMSASKLFGSGTSVSVAAGATFTSFGDNAIQTTGTPTNTIALR